MHAVILGMLGISELQRRNASPVHISRASELKAKLEVELSVVSEATKLSSKAAWRIVLVQDVVMFRLPG